MAYHLKVIGVLLIALAILHIAFPRYFKWKENLHELTLLNQQIMYVHTFFIALVVFLIGLLCLTSSNELMETALGKKIALGFFIFWVMRLGIQFFGYSSKLWKGKRFETNIHIIFSVLFTYLSTVFFIVFWTEK